MCFSFERQLSRLFSSVCVNFATALCLTIIIRHILFFSLQRSTLRLICSITPFPLPSVCLLLHFHVCEVHPTLFIICGMCDILGASSSLRLLSFHWDYCVLELVLRVLSLLVWTCLRRRYLVSCALLIISPLVTPVSPADLHHPSFSTISLVFLLAKFHVRTRATVKTDAFIIRFLISKLTLLLVSKFFLKLNAILACCIMLTISFRLLPSLVILLAQTGKFLCHF